MPVITKPPIGEHLSHMTDGRWHDGCWYCLERRVKGGTGVPDAEMAAYETAREAAPATAGTDVTFPVDEAPCGGLDTWEW